MDSTIVLPTSLVDGEEFLVSVSVSLIPAVALLVPSVALLVMNVVPGRVHEHLLRIKSASGILDTIEELKGEVNVEGLNTHGMGIGTKRGAMAAPKRAAPTSFFSLKAASVEATNTTKATIATARTRILVLVCFGRIRNPVESNECQVRIGDDKVFSE